MLQSQEERYDEEDYDLDINDETMSLIVRKFSKFIKKRRGLQRFPRKEARDSVKKSKNPKDRFT
ncbi:hypothetical protein Lal_00038040 [Lupinus albus]|nr:hypothetical protein Lal_00038040 [Lupinus albus]